ncbi:MAG: holo-ACP synthase [Gemmatimonadales bacterium]|nr:holo-ACP synthase [Gemmatimonadota bacterium]MCC7131304.1 holo-ACP synthase [Gemmatimonadales bacterium]MDX2057625.1 holo-ACP synthase [Gemmatimonadales bacterium]
MAVIGLGIDVVDIARAEAMLAEHRKRVLDRLLTEGEHAYVMGMPHPPRHLAVRLAAKEAVYKALQVLPGSRAVGWREIEVTRADHGRPVIALHGLAHRLVDERIGARIHLSLTHSELSAVAVAILEE